MDRQHTGRLRKRDNLLTGEVGGGGRGAESYYRKKAWPSINHSILSGRSNTIFHWPLAVRPLICCKIGSKYIFVSLAKYWLYTQSDKSKNAKLARCLLYSVCCIMLRGQAQACTIVHGCIQDIHVYVCDMCKATQPSGQVPFLTHPFAPNTIADTWA